MAEARSVASCGRPRLCCVQWQAQALSCPIAGKGPMSQRRNSVRGVPTQAQCPLCPNAGTASAIPQRRHSVRGIPGKRALWRPTACPGGSVASHGRRGLPLGRSRVSANAVPAGAGCGCGLTRQAPQASALLAAATGTGFVAGSAGAGSAAVPTSAGRVAVPAGAGSIAAAAAVVGTGTGLFLRSSQPRIMWLPSPRHAVATVLGSALI
mmetsp:Transcript_8469/g.25635  ORF Transcript_8469/g.25635 Transcript_8469/m.25635 type:complete len:209 (-) Transcript_8469:739-1365(-)|eukprot:10210-Chlamydomonas_euryale.AAC.4